MRAVIQRVKYASVTVEGVEVSRIGKGLMVLVGIEDADTTEDIEWLCGKIARLRVFNDDDGVMNISVQDAGGEVMLVSQFTLHASTKKGNRPTYIRAAKSEVAIPIFENMVRVMEFELCRKVATGTFGADMQVELINDGPVTIIIDTKNKE